MPVPVGFVDEPVGGAPAGFDPDIASVARQHLARMGAEQGAGGQYQPSPTGEDVPLNSALGMAAPPAGFLKRAGQYFGLPTATNEIIPWAAHRAFGATVPFGNQILMANSLANFHPHSMTDIGGMISPSATRVGADAGHAMAGDNPVQNMAGVAGTAVPSLAMLLAMGGMQKGLPERPMSPEQPPTIKVGMEGSPANGPMLDALGVVSPRAMHGIQFMRKLLGNGTSARVPLTETPPPPSPVGYTGTDYPMNNPSVGGAIPEAQRLPSPPPNPGSPPNPPNFELGTAPDIQQRPIQPTGNDQPMSTMPEAVHKAMGGAYTAGAKKLPGQKRFAALGPDEPIPLSAPPTVNDASGPNAPVQTVKPAREAKGAFQPSSIDAMNPLDETFIPSNMAQEGAVLGEGTVIDKISPDGKFARVLFQNKNGTIRAKMMPIRDAKIGADATHASDIFDAVEQLQTLMKASKSGKGKK